MWNIRYEDIWTNTFAKYDTGSLSTVDLKLSRKTTTTTTTKKKKKQIKKQDSLF